MNLSNLFCASMIFGSSVAIAAPFLCSQPGKLANGTTATCSGLSVTFVTGDVSGSGVTDLITNPGLSLVNYGVIGFELARMYILDFQTSSASTASLTSVEFRVTEINGALNGIGFLSLNGFVNPPFGIMGFEPPSTSQTAPHLQIAEIACSGPTMTLSSAGLNCVGNGNTQFSDPRLQSFGNLPATQPSIITRFQGPAQGTAYVDFAFSNPNGESLSSFEGLLETPEPTTAAMCLLSAFVFAIARLAKSIISF